ncbi:MAG: GtrA family protein [Candidatus Saccharimonadales bacterium]
MKDLLAQHAEKFRFALVGGFNTALDFGILFGLTALGVDKIPANYISTSVSFVFSFFANKTFTFKAKSGNAKREFLSFVIVTLIGLWVLQPLVITAVSQLLETTTLDGTITLLIAKLIATVVSLVWNYILYSRVVFKKH